MKKMRQIRRFKALMKTLVSCAGWGLLGYLLMRLELAFWLGWGMLLVALCVGVCAWDKYAARKESWE